MNYGLAAAPPVRWLISFDSGVHDAVRAFLAGMGREEIDVAGPPTDQDLKLYFDKRGQTVPLPCVRLRMKMARHHLTSEPGVEVTCSDRDLEEIKRWYRCEAMKHMGLPA
jgi:hypothetical protein